MSGCGCGKQWWTSKTAADRVVVEAKIRAALRNNPRRRERRSYRCPGDPGLWHVTSQPDLRETA